MPGLAISLLGPFQIVLDKDPVRTALWAKTQALLAYLAIEADRPHQRNVLAGLLWPDQPDDAARHSLRQAIHQLRQAIGAGSPPFLLITPQTARFNLDSDHWLDVAEFTASINACQSHPHRRRETCQACIERLQRAVTLYRGSLLEGFFLKDSAAFEEWAMLRREQLERQAIAALHSLAKHHELLRNYDGMEQMARQQIELDPLHEDARRQVMRALAWSGRRTAALAHYENFCRMLAQELGAPPEKETTALRAQILKDALPLPAPIPLRNWPVHAQITSLLGRERELAQLAASLQSPDARLMTLIGSGGVGKTRLALQAAEQQAFAFQDGACFVSLAEVSTPELIPLEIASALQITLSGSGASLAQLLDYLRETQPEMLLVLDNFEHLAEASPLLVDLLAAGPGLKLLVTSRERLRVNGEQPFPVSPLALPDLACLPTDAQDLLSYLASYPSITLFADRAKAAWPDFALTEANITTVADICIRLEGLPLSIELAAAHSNALSPQAMLARLAGRLSFLTDGARDLPARQRTLRDTLDWSYTLLDKSEKLLFAQMALFVGGCTQQAIEAICFGKDEIRSSSLAYRLLASLLDQSLLQRHEHRSETRFTMLETIREYALERLAESEKEAMQRRHALYYLRLAKAAQSKLISAQQVEWLNRLEKEHGNLRAALGWALNSGKAVIAARLGGALCHFWVMHGHLSEGRRWMERALALASDKQTSLVPSTRAMLLNGLGSLAYYQNDHAAARSFFEEGLARARQAGNKRGIAFALDGLGAQATNRGDYEQAAVYSEQSLALSRAIGDKWLSSITLINLGELAHIQGDCAQAMCDYEESLALLRDSGDRLFEAIVLHDLGQIAQDQGDYDRAKTIHTESLILCRELGSKRNIALCLEKLSGVAGAQGEPERAARLLGAAEALRHVIAAPMGAADRANYEQFVATVRAGLDEDTFSAAWAAGWAMKLEHAVAYALDWD